MSSVNIWRFWPGSSYHLLWGVAKGGLMAPTFEDLMHLAKTGDIAALGGLMELYRPYLKILAGVEIGRQLRGKVDASDVVQETFLDASRYFQAFRGEAEGQFVRWLREILAGTLANTVRRYVGTKARDVRLERSFAMDLDHSALAMESFLADPNGTPSQNAIKAEQPRLVAEALARLPADHQKVIVLRHLEGLTFAQVAERMGKTVDSVEKLWLRGITRLRQEFRDRP